MKAIKQSAGDALCGKFLALRQGYIKKMNSDEGEDDFLRLLFQAQLQSRLLSAQQMMLVNSSSSSPIMNRGYYCRARCQQQIFLNFETLNLFENSRQVLVLGCGFDSLALNIASSDRRNVATFEVDFYETIERKVETIKSLHQLPCSASANHREDIPLRFFHRIGCMRYFGCDLSCPEEVDRLLADLVELGGFDRSIPTLILTECVLVYMTNKDSTYLIRSLTSLLTPNNYPNEISNSSSSSNGGGDGDSSHTCSGDDITISYSMDTKPSANIRGKNPFFCWASYDMVNPTDPFGQTMLRNIQKRGFQLPGFLDCPTLSHHEDRFLRYARTAHDGTITNILESSLKDTGVGADAKEYQWRCKSRTMLQLYNFRDGIIDEKERKRIEQLELFDEVEEWNLIMSHYCMTICTVSVDTHVDLAEQFMNSILP